MKTRSSVVQFLIAALIVLTVSLSCDISYGPVIDEPSNPQQQPPVSKEEPDLAPKPGDNQAANPPVQANPDPQNEAQTNPELQANPMPEADPEPEAPIGTAVQLAWFEESDCAVPDLTRVDAGYGPGALRCEYRWSGKYIDDNNALIEIYELPDSTELSQQFEEGMNDAHVSADDQTDNEMLSIVRNDENGFIFIFTFPGGVSSKTNSEIPQCGRGSGYEKINDRFLVQVRLFSCDISDSAVDYVRTLETMKAVAEAAITRALSAINP